MLHRQLTHIRCNWKLTDAIPYYEGMLPPLDVQFLQPACTEICIDGTLFQSTISKETSLGFTATIRRGAWNFKIIEGNAHLTFVLSPLLSQRQYTIDTDAGVGQIECILLPKQPEGHN